MINIYIQDIISIDFELKEIEKVHSSFNCSVQVKFYAFQNPETSIKFESLWFEIEAFDEFMKILSKTAPHQTGQLSDMSSHLIFKLKPGEENLTLSCNINKRSTENLMNIDYSVVLGVDQFEILKNAFIKFERWW